ncbi:transposase [Planctomycetota bacterium]
MTSGAFSLDGSRFYRLPHGFLNPLEALVQTRVLRELHDRELLSEERYRLILGWRHSGGFSVFAGRPIAAGDNERLERLARYVRRPPLAASKVIYDEVGDRVVFRSPSGVHPGFKANFRLFSVQDFVAEVCGFIPLPWKHETIACGEYANVVRGRRKRTEEREEVVLVEPEIERIHAAWRHLIKHIYEVDPLTCPRCGEEMRIVSIIEQREVIRRILTHHGMWSPPKRPPKVRKPRAGPSAHPRPSRPVRPRARHEDHHSQANAWNEEDLSQAPPDWDDQISA